MYLYLAFRCPVNFIRIFPPGYRDIESAFSHDFLAFEELVGFSPLSMSIEFNASLSISFPTDIEINPAFPPPSR